jgi:branched-chain amino acid transport system substrate-binding protein
VADEVAVAIGHLCSNAAIPASAVYEAARIPFITVASNSLVTGRGFRWTFRGDPPDDANARFTAAYIVRQFAAKRIAIIHDTRAYGQGLAELIRTGLAELGLRAVLFEAVQPGQLLFTELIERLRANVDVLYYGGYPREIGLLRRQMADAAFLPPTIIAATNTSEEFGLIAGRAAEGTLVVAERPFDTAEFSQFEARFRAAYHVGPDLRATRGYRSAKIWAQAAAAAGTSDGTAVAQALHSQTFHVFGTDAGFDAQGNARGSLGEVAVWVWRGGKPVPLPSDASARISGKP